MHISLSFPQASAVHQTHPFLYEATFAPEKGEAAVRRVLSSRICLPEDDYWAAGSETISVRLDQLPPPPFKVAVRAVSALGVKSAPLTATFKG